MKLQLLEDKYYINNKLEPTIWDGYSLNDEVYDALINISSTFFNQLHIQGLIVEDIILTGSICNFNYTTKSDIDLHFIVDFNNLPPNCPIPFDDYFNTKKKVFNIEHDITIYGRPVEIYIEDSNFPSKSQGKYSIIKHKWLSIPNFNELNQSYDFDMSKLTEIVSEIKNIISSPYNIDSANEMLDKIYQMRTDALTTDGEFSEGNIIFKFLRNDGWVELLKKYIQKNIDNDLSL